jgi:tRNA(adenine34) deaminase
VNDFETRVRRQIDKLRNMSYREIETEAVRKRATWFLQQPPRPLDAPPPTPRDAYEMLFFDYMGLAEDTVPVLSETDTEIVWSSLNPCPTLEACQRLGLDTRTVCRAAYEKSTQVLVSFLDPQLRFLRSYEEIRPYAHHCLERIVRVDFEAMMTLALEEAQLSRAEGNKGYGAVVALGNTVIGQAHDTATTEGDPSLHAEMNAIRQAVKTIGDNNLSGAVLFSTCEPCPMCAGLAVWANLTAIVYGASIEETAQLGKQRIRVSVQEIIANGPVMIEVIGGVLRDQCLALYASSH